MYFLLCSLFLVGPVPRKSSTLRRQSLCPRLALRRCLVVRGGPTASDAGVPGPLPQLPQARPAAVPRVCRPAKTLRSSPVPKPASGLPFLLQITVSAFLGAREEAHSNLTSISWSLILNF